MVKWLDRRGVGQPITDLVKPDHCALVEWPRPPLPGHLASGWGPIR
jgi:hypothetical protein